MPGLILILSLVFGYAFLQKRKKEPGGGWSAMRGRVRSAAQRGNPSLALPNAHITVALADAKKRELDAAA